VLAYNSSSKQYGILVDKGKNYSQTECCSTDESQEFHKKIKTTKKRIFYVQTVFKITIKY
jgi:hypothetical protein